MSFVVASFRRYGSVLAAALGGLLIIAPSAPGAVLHDQTTGTPTGVVPSSGIVGPQAADDFVVPPGPSWEITSIDARGSGGIAGSSYTFQTYKDGGGLPGADDYIRSVAASSADNLRLMLGAVPYSPGRYWVSLLGSGWSWRTQSPQSGFEAAWRGSGCPTFEHVSACGQPGPDLQFQLTGRVVSSEFQLGEPVRSPNGGVDIRATFPHPGLVDFGGRGLKPKQKSIYKNRTGVAPDYVFKQNISLTPIPSVKKKLTAGKRKRTTAVITYTPYAESEFATAPRTLTVKLLLKRPGHGDKKKN